MAQFQVPQFIETEDKIIGPFTLRQFIYLAIAGGISAFCFLLFETFLAFAFTAILMGLAALLAFVKINGRSVGYFIQSAFSYLWHPQVYVFKAEDGQNRKNKVLSDSPNDVSGLRDLGDKIATSKNAVPKRELALPPSNDRTQKNVEKYEAVRGLEGDVQTARRIDYR